MMLIKLSSVNWFRHDNIVIFIAENFYFISWAG